ncbi:hypothetical protein M5689_004398 [Euphorbia peplus]|nr:hypothetical protein M5689_004398 [Euphorbia peplus]
MGNHTSSCFKISTSKPKTAKLIDFNGNLTRVKLPVKAAELMLEHPGYVLSPVHDLQRTGRLIALRAEDELLPSKVYLLVSLSRVNQKMSESEMKIVGFVGVKIARKKRQRGAKVLPDVEVVGEIEVLEEGDGSSGGRVEKFGHWTPVLDTISEEVEEFLV